jgi:hypothetical protein
MFKPIPGGTKVIVEGPEAPFECWIPPVGFGCHNDTGEIAKTDIIKRSKKKSEQYWERFELPKNWKEKILKEKIDQKTDKDYIDPFLNKIRKREWTRRLYGVWFWNNGSLVYITGQHYMLLNYWRFQGKWFDFRIPNKEYYYVLQYCIEDENCLGLIEITKRKEGKTARAGLFLYEYISRTEAKHGGIQSKTDKDAQEVIRKAVITPWRKLPEFFKPVFDRGGGDNPTKELRFYNTSKRGKVKEEQEEDDALESFIDVESASPDAYDGPELHRYVSDEAGKLKKHSILERHETVMFCSEVDGEYVGKQLYTTTVEEMESGGSDFKELVRQSNRNERDPNGRTLTGLYVYFLAADRTLYYNKFGEPDVERGRLYHMNKRQAQKNPRSLSSYIRKNPFTLQEAFRVDGEKCLYDSEKLNDQLDKLSWSENVTTRGNFVWEKGERDTKVIFIRDNQRGRWEVTHLFDKPEESNKVSRIGNHYRPLNLLKYVGGADTFSHDVVLDNRRSDGAMLVKMKFDPNCDSIYNNSFVCKYKFRAESSTMQYEDMLKTAVYYGCQILFESNKNNWKQYFISRGYESFLMKLKGYPDYGMPASKKTHELLAETTEEYILEHSQKVWFKDVLTNWLEFDINNTTKFDVAMAAGYALIADNRLFMGKAESKLRPISDYGFKKHKIA